jgi:hypothetical protein
MGPLLVVIVGVCALAAGAQVARGFWARARSVQRHQHALDTLAGITQGPEATSAETPRDARGLRGDHQAHVRVIGPGGPVEASGAPLPPPRPFARSSQANPSPLRRPSRSAPSAAAIDAVTASATLPGTEGARLVRTRSPEAPAGGVAGGAAAPGTRTEDATLPGLLPPPPVAGEPPTRPVAAVRPHVFYFDDTSGRAVPDEGAPPGKPLDKRDGAEASPPAGTAPSPAAAQVAGTGRGRAPVRWLAAATVVVAFGAAAVALLLTRAPNGNAPHLSAPPSTTLRGARSTGATGSNGAAPTSATVRATTAPTTTTTTSKRSLAPPPAKPAVLVRTAGGTATYQLTSPGASIVVQASGPCWIEVRVGSKKGRVFYQGTLEGGMASRVTGPAWIRLGDPIYAHVTVDGDHMPIPGATKAVPLNLVFILG